MNIFVICLKLQWPSLVTTCILLGRDTANSLTSKGNPTLHNDQDVRQCATEGNDYGVTDRAKAR
jgi:hypothetical protein